MCEAEEVLNWLLEEIERKSKEATKCHHSLYDVWPLYVFDEEVSKALDSVGDLGSELRALVPEAKQRLKEARQKVAA